MVEVNLLPVRKVGKDCYQWGNQKVYCGKDAKKKATLQGIAIENTGWKEAEEIDFAYVPNMGITIPSQFGGGGSVGSGDRPLWLRKGHYLIGTSEHGKWAVYDLDTNEFIGWNYVGSPFGQKYWDWTKTLSEEEEIKYSDRYGYFDIYKQLLSFEDAIILVDYMNEKEMKAADKFWRDYYEYGESGSSTSFMTDGERRALRYQMNDEEKEMARHPNRSQDWIPQRLIKEKTQDVKDKLECKKCGAKRFGTLVAAKRHQFYCDKYGAQPPNGLYFTPISLMLLQGGGKLEAEESQSFSLPLLTSGVILGILIPYFLDSRANKV
jgi:hypothetical protein